MKTIEIKVTDGYARMLKYALRKKYGKDKRTTLNKLCRIAIWRELCEQLQKNADEDERKL